MTRSDHSASFRSLLGWYLPVVFLVSFVGYIAVMALVFLFFRKDGCLTPLFTLLLVAGMIHLLGVLVSVYGPMPKPPHPFEPNWSEIDPDPKRVERLWRLIDGIAEHWDMPSPDEIRFDGQAFAHVFEEEDGHRVLVMGGVLMALMSEAALAGILAHELAHFKHGDTSYSHSERRQLIQLNNLALLVFHQPYHWFNPGFWFVGICCRRILARGGAERQEAEFAADEYSANQSGPEVVAAALVYSHVVDALPWSNLMNVVEKVIKTGSPDHDVFAEQVRMMRGTPAHEWAEFVKREMKKKTNPYDSHPCLRDRLKALGVKSKEALELLLDHDGPRASDLVDGWQEYADRLGKKITSRYRVYYYEMREFRDFLIGRRD